MKRTGLDAISKRTEDLWNQVNEKYGEHAGYCKRKPAGTESIEIAFGSVRRKRL